MLAVLLAVLDPNTQGIIYLIGAVAAAAGAFIALFLDPYKNPGVALACVALFCILLVATINAFGAT